MVESSAAVGKKKSSTFYRVNKEYVKSLSEKFDIKQVQVF